MESVEKELLSNEEKLQKENEQLKAYIQNILSQMRQMDMSNVFKRLDYLFKVVENSEAFYNNSSDFVNACIKEIEELLTLKEEETKEE